MIVDLNYNCDHTVFIAVRLSNLQDHMIMVPDSWLNYCSEYTTFLPSSLSVHAYRCRSNDLEISCFREDNVVRLE